MAIVLGESTELMVSRASAPRGCDVGVKVGKITGPSDTGSAGTVAQPARISPPNPRTRICRNLNLIRAYLSNMFRPGNPKDSSHNDDKIVSDFVSGFFTSLCETNRLHHVSIIPDSQWGIQPLYGILPDIIDRILVFDNTLYLSSLVRSNS